MKNSIQWIRKIHQSKKRSRSAEPGPRLNCFQDNSDKLTIKCNYDEYCDECGGFPHERDISSREWKSSEEIYR